MDRSSIGNLAPTRAVGEQPALDAATLLIADPYAASRTGVSEAVEPAGFDVVAEAGNATDAIEMAQRAQPRICVVAADLPGGGLHAVAAIAALLPGTAIVVLAESPAQADLAEALEAGAAGYVLRSDAASQLPAVLSAALDGYASVPAGLLRSAVTRDGVTTPSGLPGELTARESQVFEALVAGGSTGEIATMLGLSRVTVRRYVANVLRKSGAADRADLLAMFATDGRD